MRFTGCVAYQKDICAAWQPHARADWPGREPRPNSRRAAQGIPYPLTLAPQIGFDDRASLCPGKCAPARMQPISTNTTCESSSIVISNDHTAVTASKRQDWQQPLFQTHVAEVCLESQQITGAPLDAPTRSICR
jgi:hypothetical protein